MATRILTFLLLLLLVSGTVGSAAAANGLAHQPPSLALWQWSNWWRGGSSVDMDFRNDRYYYNNTSGGAASNSGGTTYSGVANFISGVSAAMGRTAFSPTTPFFATNATLQNFNGRASIATYFNSSGVLQTAATGAARNATYSYNGSSWVANAGTLIEPATSNTIYVNDGTGGSATIATSLTSSTIATATASGTTVSLVITGAAVAVGAGDVVGVTGCSSAPYNGNFVLTFVITGANTTIRYTGNGTPAASATGCSFTTVHLRSGTLPTNWTATLPTGLAAIYVDGGGTLSESGIYYTDIRFIGTPQATGTVNLFLDSTNVSRNAASTGQTWSQSTYAELNAGTLTNITSLNIDAWGYIGGTYQCDGGSTNFTPTTAGLSTQRYSNTQSLVTTTPNCTGMTRIRTLINIVTGTGPIDMTLRIGMPQNEQQAQPTTVIQDSGGSGSRSADLIDVGTYFDATGTLQNALTLSARLDHFVSNASTNFYPLGYLSELSATNGIRNNLMVGASAPSTLPTNWTYSAAGSGITAAVAATGTEGGIPYVDIQFSGTATSGGPFYPTLYFDTTTAFAATAGNPYTLSSYMKLQSGSYAWDTTCFAPCAYLRMQGYKANGTSTSSDLLSSLVTPGLFGLQLPSVRPSTATQNSVSDATTAYLQPYFTFLIKAGETINTTIRFGGPQIESTAFASSMIPTSGVAVTRAADAFKLTGTSTNWFSTSTGTLLTEAIMEGQDTSTAQRVIQVDDGTNNNFMYLSYSNSGSGKGDIVAASGGSNILSNLYGVFSAATTYKMIASYESTFAGGAYNGGSSFNTAISSAINFGAGAYLDVGSGRATNSFNGWIQRATYFPIWVQTTALQDLTR